MIASIVGAGLKAGSAIYGGIKASKARAQIRKNLENQMRENQNWYDQRYNEDATQRADAQRLLTMTEESIKNRNKQAAGTQAVMGGTEESVAAAKEANNKALADATSRIAVAGERRKDAIEQQYMSKKDALNQQMNNFKNDTAQNIAQATQALGGVGSDMLSADNYFDLIKKDKEDKEDK